jgi:hypothetical protein
MSSLPIHNQRFTDLETGHLMIDIRRLAEEQPLTLGEAGRFIGKFTGTNGPNISTVWKWCMKGCRGVKLESICIGGKRYVTPSAIEQFIEARSQPPQPDAPVVVTITPKSSSRAEQHARRRREEIETARRRADELTGRKSPQEPMDTNPAIRSAS